jgi:metal-responsive CopG/Arc/MetJ family transcriptional regulator
METIRIVIGAELLQGIDRAARRAGQSRSALVRDALREYLRSLEIRALEERDREGYAKHPQAEGDAGLWEPGAV